MEYHTAYFWQDSERNLSSLALQQVYHKGKKLPVVFACVGWSEEDVSGTEPGSGKTGEGSCQDREMPASKPSAKVVAALMDWFYTRGLQQCMKKGEGGIYQVGRMLHRQLTVHHNDATLVGILGVGKRLCIFNLGNAFVRVLNLQKGVAYSKELRLAEGDKHGIGIQYVLMEPEVGVMLGTDGFWKGIAEVCVEECLNVKELDGKIRVEKRLRELGKQGELRGGTHMAALLLVTR